MSSVTSSDKATPLASPPQLRVVGFCATTTRSSNSEGSAEICGASPHSLPESPLSRLLRSATWPTLRVRLCKSEIPAGLPGLSHCSTSSICAEQDCFASRSGRSSSPISIPRVYRCATLSDRAHLTEVLQVWMSTANPLNAECDVQLQHVTWIGR